MSALLEVCRTGRKRFI